jgi:hypothetical protein
MTLVAMGVVCVSVPLIGRVVQLRFGITIFIDIIRGK